MSLKTIRSMFYFVTPSETYYERIEDVPDYITTAHEFLLIFQILEVLIGLYKGKKIARLNDVYSSIAAGIISHLPKLFIQSMELSLYIWIYRTFNLFPNLQWNSPITYWISFLCIDFVYYWLHRMGHEVNLFWATHQTHHSSEDYNISVALRQGFFHHYFSWLFYLPLSLILPPQIFLIHLQMNLMYQFWIHTQVISHLGPFEWIFNTPSHHRVHHGRNAYCIDKNYGGVLIIWDRLFRTFAHERDNEEIAYGLVYASPSFNPWNIQSNHYRYLYKEWFKMEGWMNKLSLVFKGPSWRPGLARLGNGQYPDIQYPIEYYHPHINLRLSIYTTIQFLYVFIQYNQILRYSQNYSFIPLIIYTIILLFSLSTFGAIFDRKSCGIDLERLRLLIILFFSRLSMTKEIFHLEGYILSQMFLILSFFLTYHFNSSKKILSNKIIQ